MKSTYQNNNTSPYVIGVTVNQILYFCSFIILSLFSICGFLFYSNIKLINKCSSLEEK